MKHAKPEGNFQQANLTKNTVIQQTTACVQQHNILN